MKLFRRQSLADGPPPTRDLASTMARFGRFENDPQASDENPSWVYANILAPLYPSATADPVEFVELLEREVSRKGGCGAYGAAHAVWELLTSEQRALLRNNRSYVAVVDASLEFLRANGVPPERVRGYEWDHWIEHGGTIDTWIPPRDPPPQAGTRISQLREGELRPIARLTDPADGNIILVRTSAEGGCTAIVDARWSDDDPRRCQTDWESADDLYALYVKVGRWLQVPPPWYDTELEAFFPLPKPKILDGAAPAFPGVQITTKELMIMGRGLKCRVCGQGMYAGNEKYEPKGTYVTYICRNDNCDNYKRSGRRLEEKVFEGK